jgi:hypothetical protein
MHLSSRGQLIIEERTCTGHGAVIGVMGGGIDLPLRGAPHHARKPQECETACAASERCTHFSHSEREGVCRYCSACELDSGSLGSGFTSWTKAAALEPTPHNASLAALAPLLQGAYSERLYGGANRVPLASLRLVWLAMLPETSLARIAQIGLCKWEPKPPLHEIVVDIVSRRGCLMTAGTCSGRWESKPPLLPFYSTQDMVANPVDGGHFHLGRRAA